MGQISDPCHLPCIFRARNACRMVNNCVRSGLNDTCRADDWGGTLNDCKFPTDESPHASMDTADFRSWLVADE